MLVVMTTLLTSRYKIATMVESAAADAARLHVEGQPDTFLTNLGVDALRHIYRVLATSAEGLGVVAVMPAAVGGDILEWRMIGFAAATTSTLALYIDVARRFAPAMASEALRASLRKPALLLQGVESALYPLRQVGQSSQNSLPSAELLAIMVDERWRGAGVGAALLDSLLRLCAARRVHHMEVTVDAANAGARRFYSTQGFVLRSEFRLNGRAMCGFELAFDAPSPVAPSIPQATLANAVP